MRVFKNNEFNVTEIEKNLKKKGTIAMKETKDNTTIEHWQDFPKHPSDMPGHENDVFAPLKNMYMDIIECSKPH